MKMKKIIAGLFAVALVGTMATMTVSASSSSAGGDDSGIGNGSGIAVGSGSFAINSGGNSGYRLYLVPVTKLTSNSSNGAETDTNDTSITVDNGLKITEDGACYLDDYKRYALYEFIDNTDNSSGGSLSRRINATAGNNLETARYLSYNGKNKYSMVAIADKQILSKQNDKYTSDNATANYLYNTTSFYFEEVLGRHGDVETLREWGTINTNGLKSEFNFEQLANWANRVFNQDRGEEFYTNFINKYKGIIGEDNWERATYPNSYDQWVRGKWTVIVEPVYITKKGNDCLIISYQDFLGSYADNELTGGDGVTARKDRQEGYAYNSNTFTKVFADALQALKWKGAVAEDPKLFYNNTYWGTTSYMFSKMKDYYTNFEDIEVTDETGAIHKINTSTKDAPYLAGFSFNTNMKDLFRPRNKDIKGMETYVLTTDNLKANTITEVDIDYRKVATTGAVSEVTEDWGITPIKKSTINLVKSSQEQGWGINKSTVNNKEDIVTDDIYGAIANFWGIDTQDKLDSDKYYLRSYSISTKDFGSGTFNLENMTTGMSNDLSVKTEVDVAQTNEGINQDSKTNFAIGDLYSTTLVGDDTVNFETVSSSEVISSTSTENDAVKSEHYKGSTYSSAESREKQVNILNNVGISALSQSNLTNITTTDSGASLKTKTGETAKTTIAVATVLPKQTVTSTVAYGERNKDGSINVNSWLGDSTPVDNITYEVVDTNYDSTNNAVRHVKIKGNEIFRSASGYAIAFPKGTVYDDSNLFYETLYSKLDDTSSIDSFYEMSYALKTMGITAEVISLSDTEDTDLYLGAGVDSEGNFVGYNIYMVSDSKVADIQTVEAELKPYELNYIYPSTTMGNEALQNLWAYTINKATPYNLYFNEHSQGNIFDFNKSHRNAFLTFADKDGNLSLGHSYDDKVFMQYGNKNYAGVKFDAFLWVGNTFESSYAHYLDYALNLSRGIYDENFVVSSISVPDDTIDNDYLSRMGITKGNKPKGYNGNTAGTTVIGSTTDKIRWSADKNMTYTITLPSGKKTEYSINPFSVRPTEEGVGFNLNTKGYMYLPHHIDTTEPDPKNGRRAILGTEGSFGLTTSSEVLNFYPEYTMLAYNIKDNNLTDEGIIKSDDYKFQTVESDIKVMGTKKRSVKASSMYCISAGNLTESNTKLYSEAEAKTSDAKALSGSFGNKPVIYAGGNIDFQTNIENLELVGYSLDIIDRNIDGNSSNRLCYRDNLNATYSSVVADGSDVRSEWGNTYNPTNEYNNWVSEVKNNLQVELTMSEWENPSSYINRAVMRADYSGIEEVSSEVVSYALTFDRNGLVKDGAYKALVESMAKRLYGSASDLNKNKAEVDLWNTGMLASIQEALEDNGDDFNTSSQTTVDNIYDNTKWYSETTKTFVIREYVTNFRVNNINCSDKVDYNWGYPSEGKLFSNGYECSFDLVVKLKNDVKDLPKNEPLINSRKIDGGKFVVSNATTSDMKY